MGDDPAIGQLVETLRRYVHAHPRAIDSAQGIRQWWLGDLSGPHDPAAVEAAIHRLASEGVVDPVRLPDGGLLWRAAPRHG